MFQFQRSLPVVCSRPCSLLRRDASSSATNRWLSITATSKNSSADQDDGIVVIGLDKPRRRNALSTAVLQSIQEQLEAAKANPSTRVVVIKSNSDHTAASTGVFCSGHDLNELQQRIDNNAQESAEDQSDYRARLQSLFHLCGQVMTQISTFPVPTIAQVDGIATAAGCQLVASCDLAVATSTSRFATPGVNIGLFCSTPAVPLVRTVARKHAMEMLLTGQLISAQRAYEMGLINRVVPLPSNNSQLSPKDEHLELCRMLEKEVHELATVIASKSKVCNELGLDTLRAQRNLPKLEDAYEVAEQAMVNNLLLDDAVEGIDAFLTKRTPSWKT